MRNIKVILYCMVLAYTIASCSENVKNNPKFKDEKGRFSVMFPGPPETSEKQVDYGLGTTKVYSFIYKPDSLDDPNLSYELSYFDQRKGYVDTFKVESIYLLFNFEEYDNIHNPQLRLSFIMNLDIYGHIGREYRWVDEKNEVVYSKMHYLVGDREYVLSVNTPLKSNNNISIRHFFNSFELSDTTRCTKYPIRQLDGLEKYYKIAFPGKTEHNNFEAPTEYGNTQFFFESFRPDFPSDGNSVYLIAVSKYRIDITKADTFNLSKFYEDQLQFGLASRQSSIISKKEIISGGVKGIEQKDISKDGKFLFWNRIFLHKDLKYNIHVTTLPKNNNNDEALRFMDSFEIVK